MILTNEFTVGADADTVWRHLLDMEGVAQCLPGAEIEATEEENTYNGSMRVRLGPMTVDYRGTATLTEADEENHTATISLRAREAKGQGTAMATIRNRLEPSDGGTRVLAETDLHITGPQAQFGRGVMEDVGGRVLAEFARRLEQQISGVDAQAEATAGEDSAGPRTETTDERAEALDLGAIVSESVRERYAMAAAAAAVLALIALLVLLRRGRR